MHKITFPVFDANITEGMIGAWLVHQGESVSPGQPLAEVVTDKANFELESEVAGTVRRIVAPEKSVVPNGYILALVGTPDEEVPDVTAENQAIVEKARAEMNATSVEGQASAAVTQRPRRETQSKRVRATPAARRLAREHDIELADIEADQPIGEDDVRHYLQQKGLA